MLALQWYENYFFKFDQESDKSQTTIKLHVFLCFFMANSVSCDRICRAHRHQRVVRVRVWRTFIEAIVECGLFDSGRLPLTFMSLVSDDLLQWLIKLGFFGWTLTCNSIAVWHGWFKLWRFFLYGAHPVALEDTNINCIRTTIRVFDLNFLKTCYHSVEWTSCGHWFSTTCSF